MKENLKIQSYCRITNNSIVVNGQSVFENKAAVFPEILKLAYRQLNLNYPKFFKMDTLSRLAFLSAELLLKGSHNSNTAIVLSNRSGSLDTDLKHQQTIDSGDYPSPSIFVYTLPNIGTGEIAIRHKLRSENAFFVFEEFNAEFLQDYSSILINSAKSEQVLCGWVEVDNHNIDGFMFLAGKQGEYDLDTNIIEKLYKA